MNPGLLDTHLALHFAESLLWGAIWVVAAIFAGEVLCIAVLCRGKRKLPAITDGVFDIS